FDNYEEIDNAELYDIDENLFKEYISQKGPITPQHAPKSKKSYPKLMLAISNKVEYMNQEVIFVAISCVTEFDMLVKAESNELNNKLEPVTIQVDDNLSKISFKQDNNLLNGKTVIYKMILGSTEKDKVFINVNNGKVDEFKVEKIGGVVSFVHDKTSSEKRTKTDCFIFNADGIHGIHGLRFNDKSSDNLEHFNYPRRLTIELNTLYKTISCISRIKNSVFDHYFHIEQI
ncbi:4174_t:CDS:1, partial [Funneliformis geosporum]